MTENTGNENPQRHSKYWINAFEKSILSTSSILSSSFDWSDSNTNCLNLQFFLKKKNTHSKILLIASDVIDGYLVFTKTFWKTRNCWDMSSTHFKPMFHFYISWKGDRYKTLA